MTLSGVFARGLLLGFSIAAPVGPIGVLCIRRTLAEGRLLGFATGSGGFGAFTSTFVLTLTNPMTILSFVAVFAALGLGSVQSPEGGAILLILGVLLGSASWWFLLSGGVSLLRARFDQPAMVLVNRGSGALITGFGSFALMSPFVPGAAR